MVYNEKSIKNINETNRNHGTRLVKVEKGVIEISESLPIMETNLMNEMRNIFMHNKQIEQYDGGVSSQIVTNQIEQNREATICFNTIE